MPSPLSGHTRRAVRSNASNGAWRPSAESIADKGPDQPGWSSPPAPFGGRQQNRHFQRPARLPVNRNQARGFQGPNSSPAGARVNTALRQPG
jgi:hypothetical protein